MVDWVYKAHEEIIRQMRLIISSLPSPDCGEKHASSRGLEAAQSYQRLQATDPQGL